MIKVTIELYPFGVEAEKRTIGEMFIANDGTGTHELGNYSYGIRKVDSSLSCSDWHHVGITKRHKREEGIYELIRKILNQKDCRVACLKAGDK